MDKEQIMNDAREALDAEKFDEAIEIIEEILSEGIDVEALELKGEAYLLKGEPKQAMKCYDRALVVNLNQKGIWKSKGIALLAVGRNDEARRSFDKAIKIDSAYTEGWLGRGKMGMKVHDWEMALESFEKVTELDPTNPAGWYNKANVLITGFGRMDEAVDCYLKAIDINGGSDEYWFSLGMAQKSMGSINEAARSFHKTLQLNINHTTARKYLNECTEIIKSQGDDISEYEDLSESSGEIPPEPPLSEDEVVEPDNEEGIEYDEDEDEWGSDGESTEEEDLPAPPDEDEEDWATEVGATDEDGFFTEWVDMEGESFAFDPPAPDDKEIEDEEEEEDVPEPDGEKNLEDDEDEGDWGENVAEEEVKVGEDAPESEETEKSDHDEDEGDWSTVEENKDTGEETSGEDNAPPPPSVEDGETEPAETEKVESNFAQTPEEATSADIQHEKEVEEWGSTTVGASDEDGFFTEWVDFEEDSFAFEISEDEEEEKNVEEEEE